MTLTQHFYCAGSRDLDLARVVMQLTAPEVVVVNFAHKLGSWFEVRPFNPGHHLVECASLQAVGAFATKSLEFLFQ